jgi:two-component system sensor histidine kinase ChvG
MTDALWQRINTISFAAEHELKNADVARSAIEAAARPNLGERRDKLMAIVMDDINRLNRLTRSPTPRALMPN